MRTKALTNYCPKEVSILIPLKYMLTGLKVLIAILVDLMDKHHPSEIIESERIKREIECHQEAKKRDYVQSTKGHFRKIWK